MEFWHSVLATPGKYRHPKRAEREALGITNNGGEISFPGRPPHEKFKAGRRHPECRWYRNHTKDQFRVK